jgi:aminobenzoyl-glutamate transport protein
MNGSTGRQGLIGRTLGVVERVGNKLPDPTTLFVLLGVLVLVMSWVGTLLDWSVVDPRDPTQRLGVVNLLTADGIRRLFTGAIQNFLDFPPLAIVLVAMLGIGVAERTGLFPALLKLIVSVTPSRFLTPVVVFIGVNASAAADAGYVVLPPLAAGVYAMVGRSPLVGIAAATFGIAGGFSANLAVTSLDPLLSSLTQQAAALVDPKASVQPTCNYYFMIASTFMLTLVGWFVTARIVEPRFGAAEIEAQIRDGGIERAAPRLDDAEKRGLRAAVIAFAACAALFLALALVPGWPLTGMVQRHNSTAIVPAWSEALIPMILVLFLAPGIAYGAVSGEIRSDRAVAQRMNESMASMGSYIVLAFFAGQALAWFKQSNLALVLGFAGGELIKSIGAGEGAMIASIVVVVAVLNLLVSSASAKWAFLAPILVPMLGAAGMSPELVQCAYRVGDSCTNPIAPLNAYLVIILVVMRRYCPQAGLGTLLSLLVPYSVATIVVWTVVLVAWNAAGLPLGF